MPATNQTQLATGNPYHVVITDAAGAPSRLIAERIAALGSARDSSSAAKPTCPSLTETLFDLKSSFKLRTALIAMHITKNVRNKFFSQIDGLLDVEEWDLQDKFPDLKSLDTFLRLQFSLKMTRRPSLGLAFNGNFVAAWLMDQGSLTIECLPDDVLKWALIVKHIQPAETAAGTTTINRIEEILEPFKVEIWSRS